MIRNWDDIKWIFEPDGSLRDIYVQDVTISHWEKLIDFLNLNYELKFGENEINQINKEYVLRYLNSGTGEMESKSLKIDLNGINVHCYFFLPEQIEFDIDPKDINTIKEFENIEMFMISISKTLNNQVTLTGENSPEFPLFKIDFDKKINKVLTKKEANELLGKQNSILTQFNFLKTRVKMRFFSRKFESQIMKSVNDTYKPTGKNKNVW